MHAVFVEILLTEKGKSPHRCYKLHQDAQKIYEDLLAHAETSTKLSVESAQILAYITTANPGDGAWRGSTEDFILHWQNQIRKYNLLVKYGDQMYDYIKHTMLENTVNGISDLRDVKTQAAQFRAQMRTNLACEKYCTLVLSAAQAYDSQHTTKENSRGTRRSVYNSTIQHQPTDNYIDESYNIDSSISQLNINNVNNDYNPYLDINNVNT